MSHSFALASHAPDTKVRESGANDKDITSPVCPMNEVHCWPVSISHKALNQNNSSSSHNLQESSSGSVRDLGVGKEEIHFFAAVYVLLLNVQFCYMQ